MKWNYNTMIVNLLIDGWLFCLLFIDDIAIVEIMFKIFVAIVEKLSKKVSQLLKIVDFTAKNRILIYLLQMAVILIMSIVILFISFIFTNR